MIFSDFLVFFKLPKFGLSDFPDAVEKKEDFTPRKVGEKKLSLRCNQRPFFCGANLGLGGAPSEDWNFKRQTAGGHLSYQSCLFN